MGGKKWLQKNGQKKKAIKKRAKKNSLKKNGWKKTIIKKTDGKKKLSKNGYKKTSGKKGYSKSAEEDDKTAEKKRKKCPKLEHEAIFKHQTFYIESLKKLWVTGKFPPKQIPPRKTPKIEKKIPPCLKFPPRKIPPLRKYSPLT